MSIIDFTNVEKVYRGSVEMKKVYEGQTVVWEKPVPVDYFYIQNEYAGSNVLTLTKNGSALTTASDLEYSLDKTNWTRFNLTQAINTISIPQGGKVYMRSSTGFSTDGSNYLAITTSEDCSAGGDVMSLIDYTNINSVALQSHCFDSLFESNSHLISVNNLSLPRTTLATYCYQAMFWGCTGLTSIPSGFLPATTLADHCYRSMFKGCTSLTQAPVLPATTLNYYCYYQMFSGCSGLVTAPTLSSTTLAIGCYAYMFNGCTSLTQAPVLPATTLAQSCYQSMFGSCTSLIQAPELPAVTLAQSCYSSMFNGCTSLKEVWCYAQDISANYCLSNWLSNVANDGTLHKPIDNDSFSWMSASGIPSSWHVKEIENITWGNEDYFRIYNMSSGTNNIHLSYNNPAGAAVATFPNLKYSTDNGQTWTSWTGSGGNSLNISLSGKSYLLFKDGTGNSTSVNISSDSYRAYWRFSSSGDFKVSGSLSYFVNTSSSSFNIGGLFHDATNLVGVKYDLLSPVSSSNTYLFYYLFRGCSKLVQAPNLTKSTIPSYGYFYMFSGCTNLKFIRCVATNITASNCVNGWTQNVSSSGVFVRHAITPSWPNGSSGIPTGWTVVSV